MNQRIPRITIDQSVLISGAIFLVVSLLTHAHLTGDGPVYVASVVSRVSRGLAGPSYWDAGHLLWRPLAFVIATMTGAASAASISRIFIAFSWFGAAVSSVVLPAWLRRVGVSRTAAVWSSVSMITANAVLAYYQGGSSYTASLACLLVGLHPLSVEASRFRAIVAGLSLAAAVLLWLPFVLALPAALAAPVLLRGFARATVRTTLWATLACALAGAVAYGGVAVHLGISTPAQFIAWLNDASHGITKVKGLSRTVFGFARSFLNMGADGAVLKRYLLHDPYNPVSKLDLFRHSLIKVAWFYLVLVGLVISVWRNTRGRALLWFFVAAFLPVLLFAIAWQGGDPERYLALYPAFLLALAFGVDDRRRLLRGVAMAFVAMCAFVNILAYSRWEFAREEARVRARFTGFRPELLPAGSILVSTTDVDGLTAYVHSGAVGDLRAIGQFNAVGLLIPGYENATQWRSFFASKALESWAAGGRVWVTRRAFSTQPAADWGWVEGEDPRLHWADFRQFFASLDATSSVGGSDGFVELPASDRNRAALHALAIAKQVSPDADKR